MANRFDLNGPVVRGILNGDAMEAALSRDTNAIAEACGEGFEASVQKGRNRIQASVITATAKARARERKYRILERSVDRGRS